jgi:hypothetical protein
MILPWGKSHLTLNLRASGMLEIDLTSCGPLFRRVIN